MKQVRIVARLLQIITFGLGIIYTVGALWSAFALGSHTHLSLHEEGSIFKIHFPFTERPVLVGEYNVPYILFDFLGPLGLYGLFFFLASGAFKVFSKDPLFTQKGVNALSWFYKGNLLVPLLFLVLASCYVPIEEEGIVLTMVHFVLGIFAYFLAAIFKKGVQLQQEQDLII